MLTRREATLRAAAAACLAGIALVQALALTTALDKGWQFGVLALAGMALCVVLGMALAMASADAAGPLWRVVAGAALLVVAGWAAPHAFAVPGLSGARGHWTTLPGAASPVLAAACLALALTAARPTRAAVRGLVTAVAVLVAIGPGVGALLVAIGPGPAGGETALALGHAHVHAASAEASIEYRPGPNGGSYVYRGAGRGRTSPFGLALGVAAALVFTYGAVGALRRRVAPADSLVPSGVEGRLA